MLDTGAAFDAENPCELEVGTVLAAIVQQRLGKLAAHLKAEFPEGREPVWRDVGHLRGLDVVEMGTVERNGVSGAKVEWLNVLYRHLYPKEPTVPDFRNNPNAADRLTAAAKELKIEE